MELEARRLEDSVAAQTGLQPFGFDENPTSSSTSSSVSTMISSSDVKERERFRPEWNLNENIKEILVIDDDQDSAFAIKACLESYKTRDNKGAGFSTIQVTMYVDPVKALSDFRPYHFDLMLVDINMPTVNGYELVEKVIRLDLNIKVCFMSSGEMNYEAIREIRHPARSFGCFIKKPASSDYLVNRVIHELF